MYVYQLASDFYAFTLFYRLKRSSIIHQSYMTQSSVLKMDSSFIVQNMEPQFFEERWCHMVLEKCKFPYCCP